MKKVKAWFSKLSLRYKWVLTIYGVLLPVLMACTVFFYYNSYQSTKAEQEQLRERFAQNACREIEALQQDLLDIATYFVVNAQIKNILLTPPSNEPQDLLFWYEDSPMNFVEDIFAVKNHMKTLMLYPENGFAPYILSGDLTVCNTDFAQIKASPFYQKAVAAQGDVLWEHVAAEPHQLFLQTKNEKIVAYREIFDLSKKNRLGFLVLGMDAKEYSNICTAMLQTEEEGVAVLSQQGEVLVQEGTVPQHLLALIKEPTTQQALKNSAGSYKLSDNIYDIYISASNSSGIQVCYFSARATWVAMARKTLAVPVALMFVLTVIAIPLSSVFSYVTLRSTKALYQGMKKFENGDFTYQIPVETGDEIGALSKAFNNMVTNLRDLVDKNYILALREKESELDALQTQINPHFLYNALDCLYWQAVNHENEELGENILALSQMFRQLLSQGQSTISVRQEIELIQSYLKIQKMRFGDKLQYSIDLDAEVLACRIPKLTLQPFVENAVVHGLESSLHGGEITVTGKLIGTKLHFMIQDNGAGMTQTQADILLEDETSQEQRGRISHFAIRNIKQRLALRYQTDYTLKITSNPGKGTCVEVSFPAYE